MHAIAKYYIDLNDFFYYNINAILNAYNSTFTIDYNNFEFIYYKVQP